MWCRPSCKSHARQGVCETKLRLTSKPQWSKTRGRADELQQGCSLRPRLLLHGTTRTSMHWRNSKRHNSTLWVGGRQGCCSFGLSHAPQGGLNSCHIHQEHAPTGPKAATEAGAIQSTANSAVPANACQMQSHAAWEWCGIAAATVFADYGDGSRNTS